MKHVLVVDDLSSELHIIKSILEEKDYRVSVASSGQEALESAKRDIPDLILMDVIMNGMNGFQATRELGRVDGTKDIPVIMVTMKNLDLDRAWAEKQGAVDYVVKPIDRKVLLNTVSKHLT